METEQKALNNWQLPHTDKDYINVSVVVRIAKDGSIMGEAKVVKSNDRAFDNSCIIAVKNTKFDPLPKEFENEYADIELTFEANKKN